MEPLALCRLHCGQHRADDLSVGESAPELRLFGVIPATRVQLVLGALLLVILAFGYWLVGIAH